MWHHMRFMLIHNSLTFENLFYNGTLEEWNGVNKNEFWNYTYLSSAEVYFYSENESTDLLISIGIMLIMKQ